MSEILVAAFFVLLDTMSRSGKERYIDGINNDKTNSTRLVFIDEPFAKMDPTNIRTMLKFMKNQKLQMIFCAPDKTELIGNECQVILPVLRTKPDLMEIGIVEIHEGASA